MAASYPGAIKNFSAIVNGVTKLVAALFNSPYEEITAIQTELGTDVAGSAADLKTRLAVSIANDGKFNMGQVSWVQFSGSTINDSYNVTSVSDDGAGLYTVTWDTDFSNDDYSIVATSGNNTYLNYTCLRLTATPILVGSVLLATNRQDGGYEDANWISVIAIGDR